MTRPARITAAGLVYHVTHRGNRRGDVFFTREDREEYLRMLARAGRRCEVEVWAYCLMTNHVHLLVRGERADSLGRAMCELQSRYARYINRRMNWSGHLWANRFYSNPLDGEQVWAAVRYIERNPVRARMTSRAVDYHWSSAKCHCGLEGPGILALGRPFPGPVDDWESWLMGGDGTSDDRLRAASRTGRPLGCAAFRSRLERELGRPLLPRPRGRPRKLRRGGTLTSGIAPAFDRELSLPGRQ